MWHSTLSPQTGNSNPIERYEVIAFLLFLMPIVVSCNSRNSTPDSDLILSSTTTELNQIITGATNPEEAAVALVTGITERSPQKFLKHLCLGVCDGPISTHKKYSESPHTTKLKAGNVSASVIELASQIQPASANAIHREEFDTTDPRVINLASEMMSTYYGTAFQCVWVSVQTINGVTYETQVVVTRKNDLWYCIPACKSSKSFYAIAEDMNRIDR